MIKKLIQLRKELHRSPELSGYFPFKFGEDFGWFSKEYKTAIFGLGAGRNCPALHNANYDFPDEVIETGLAMFKAIISNIMLDRILLNLSNGK